MFFSSAFISDFRTYASPSTMGSFALVLPDTHTRAQKTRVAAMRIMEDVAEAKCGCKILAAIWEKKTAFLAANTVSKWLPSSYFCALRHY